MGPPHNSPGVRGWPAGVYAALDQQDLPLLESAAASRPHLGSKGDSGLALRLMLPLLDVITRSQKVQRPKVCPQEGAEEPEGEGRPPEAHS